MRKVLVVSLTIFAAVVNFQCSSSQAVATLPPGIQAANYTTYRIRPYEEWDPQHQAVMSTDDQVRIEKALKHEVESRGMVRHGQPDIFVTYMLEVNKETSYNNNYYGNGYYGGRYYSPYGAPYGGSNDRPGYNITKNARLYIQVVDVRSNKIIWYNSEKYPTAKNIEKADRKLVKAMDKIFEDFPFGKPTGTSQNPPLTSEN